MSTKEEEIDYFMSILTPIDGFDKFAGKNRVSCPFLFSQICYFSPVFHENFCG
ncbi:hypothetical protein [Oxalobacter paraformigenes]|uniref:hypothetical protein n=1 Tax=Oxalobacter paraformigenes TaxID=556268 RepID=UPI0018C9B469|nr:hypothetical protein [Oxalobacter paraformigenes]